MNSPDAEIRQYLPADQSVVYAVVRDAFGRDVEPDLVERLRASTDYLPELELVAESRGQLVGQIMVTRAVVTPVEGDPIPTLMLSPLAVAPGFQGQGIGKRLCEAALEIARTLGHRSMTVLGHPTYYPKVGFRPASTWGIQLSFPVPDEVFMAIELIPGGLNDSAGVITLPAPFDGV